MVKDMRIFVKAEMKRQKMNQGDLSKAVGMSQKHISDLLTGRRSMKDHVLDDILKAFGIEFTANEDGMALKKIEKTEKN